MLLRSSRAGSLPSAVTTHGHTRKLHNSATTEHNVQATLTANPVTQAAIASPTMEGRQAAEAKAMEGRRNIRATTATTPMRKTAQQSLHQG